MKIKERYVWLACVGCEAPGRSRYTTHKRQKAPYKVEKKKYCTFCRKHALHREKKL
jgi:large subunit ribosomal protein L33